jgi:hypothetical protein
MRLVQCPAELNGDTPEMLRDTDWTILNPRRVDVLEQTRLVRPEVNVVDSLEALAVQLRGAW